jgi:hypothetical protein
MFVSYVHDNQLKGSEHYLSALDHIQRQKLIIESVNKLFFL